MAAKRSRAAFESDLPPHAPFAAFGTPLPDEDSRDDGSYLPLWKQDVRDEKGRRRLHGAFTGGFSAGYFNTVGSKEGWTPSAFVSSRANRRKDDKSTQRNRAEDYMDDEDLADATEAQKVQTSQAFAGLGASGQEGPAPAGIVGLLRPQGDSMGLKLLRRMGWKDGQGVGPKVRRHARLDVANGGTPHDTAAESFLFAPDDVATIEFNRKTDRKGLGFHGESRLAAASVTQGRAEEEEEAAEEEEPWNRQQSKPQPKQARGGMGVGVLNDVSDDEDPYEIGPKIKYNRVIGGDKKKKKAKKLAMASANPALRNVPTFVPKTARGGGGFGRCHDGKLPLDGFLLAKVTEDLSVLLLKYAPPVVPDGWVSHKAPNGTSGQSISFTSTGGAAKASTHDPRSRAAMLGEQALPGKSVFDFLSASARDRLAAGSGKSNLPPARGEVPEGFEPLPSDQKKALWARIPKLDRATALEAISRGSTGPYADDEAKRSRYRQYLEQQAEDDGEEFEKPPAMSDEDFIREGNEFYNCARIFRPMTGFMASRFTTAKSTTPASDTGTGTQALAQEPVVLDAAEEAANMGMYGALTRKEENFHPTRLLCKRFNVKPPAHSQADQDAQADKGTEPSFTGGEEMGTKPEGKLAIEAPPVKGETDLPERPVQVNPEKNDAVDGGAAHGEVLRAIFGDSDSE